MDGKTIVQSTRAGTVGVAAATNADDHLPGLIGGSGSHGCGGAARQPRCGVHRCHGRPRRHRSDEDEQCALYLRNLLEGRQPDPAAVRSLIMDSGQTQKFFDDSQPQFHPNDVELALQINRFSFAMQVHRENGLLVARKEEPA